MVPLKKLVAAFLLWCLVTWAAVAYHWYSGGEVDSIVLEVWLIGALIAVCGFLLVAIALKLGKDFTLGLLICLMFWNLGYFAVIDPERIRSRMLLLAAMYLGLSGILYLVARREGAVGKNERRGSQTRGRKPD